MGADDGIYILEAADGYRVIHDQGMQNLFWDDIKKQQSDDINLYRLYLRFKDAQVLKNKRDAEKQATRLEDNRIKRWGCPCDRGIIRINRLSNSPFPTFEEAIEHTISRSNAEPQEIAAFIKKVYDDGRSEGMWKALAQRD